MEKTLMLYRLAERKHIPVLPCQLPKNGSLCLQDEAGDCFIGIDEALLEDEAHKCVHLAHELGHCMTGSFYNRYAKIEIRQKHENRADKWAIKKLVPKDKLDAAVAAGYTEPWQLAEYFNVTEEFIRKAMCWYINGNLAVEQY